MKNLHLRDWPWAIALLLAGFVANVEAGAVLEDPSSMWRWILLLTLPLAWFATVIFVAMKYYLDGQRKGAREALLDYRSGELWVNWTRLEEERQREEDRNA